MPNSEARETTAQARGPRRTRLELHRIHVRRARFRQGAGLRSCRLGGGPEDGRAVCGARGVVADWRARREFLCPRSPAAQDATQREQSSVKARRRCHARSQVMADDKKDDVSGTVKLISADGHEFVIDRKAAMVSGTIRSMLSGPGTGPPARGERSTAHF